MYKGNNDRLVNKCLKKINEMHQTPDPLKTLSKLALFLLSVLFVGGIVFYKERIIFADSAFKIFNIINYRMFSISENRYGSIITQVVPYAMMRMHLSAKAIIKAYAFGFNFIYLTAGVLLVYRFKQYKLAIILALYFTLIVSASYYWPCDEIHVAIAYLFITLGIMLHYGKENKVFAFISIIIGGFLTIYTHVLVIIPFGFIWMYLILDKNTWPFSNRTTIILSGMIIIMFLMKFILVPVSSYSVDKVNSITHITFKSIIQGLLSPNIRVLINMCITNYWIGVIVFFSGLISLILQRKILQAALLVGSVIGYLIVVGLAYSDINDVTVNSCLFHIETEWASLGIIIATPFVYSVLPRMKTRVGLLVLGLIFTIRLGYIYACYPDYTWRTNFKNEVFTEMKKKGITKLAIINNRELMTKFKIDWALSEESILTSAINNDNPCLTFAFIDTNDKNRMEQLRNPKGFFFSFGLISPTNLNGEYFSLDSIHPYRIMTYDELIK